MNDWRRDFTNARIETLFWFVCVAAALPVLVLALASVAGCDVHGTPPPASNRARATTHVAPS